MLILVSLILSTIAVYVTGNILPGVKVDSFGTALIVAVVLGLINSLLRPLLFLLTLPINFLTLGLFTFVIMGFCVWLTAQIVPGFHVSGFWWSIVVAITLAVINSFLQALSPNSL
jgi:putative membrane protein